MFAKFPSAETPLNYEHVLYTHLEAISFFMAQQRGSFEEIQPLIDVYEQYVIPVTSRNERTTLRKFKLVFTEIWNAVNEEYDIKLKQAKNADKPEELTLLVEEERNDTLLELKNVYFRLLLRYLTTLTKRRTDTLQAVYLENELWIDLQIELAQININHINVMEIIQKVSSLFEELEKEEEEGKKGLEKAGVGACQV